MPCFLFARESDLHPITRRALLKGAAALAAGMAAPERAFPVSQVAAAPGSVALTINANTLAHYVDPLPLPKIAQPCGFHADPENTALRLPLYRMTMRQIEAKLHRDLPATRLWGFESSSPGPAFETRSGQGLIVEWVNELPNKHFLPIDHNAARGRSQSAPGAQRDSSARRQDASRQ